MAPTICSGKKRQTRTIATTEIRRHGQRSQLNQALSNIVNYVAKGSINPRVSASLRIQTHNPVENNTTGSQQHHNTNNEASTNNNNNRSHKHSIQTSATLAANHRRQQFSSISDNAVTSSTHSDTENSYDLRLATETLINDATTTNSSSNINPSSLSIPSTSSSSSHKEMSSSLCDERRFQRYSSSTTTTSSPSSSSVSKVQANDFNDENDVTDTLYKDDDNDNYSALNKEVNKKHSKHFFKYSEDEDADAGVKMSDDDVDSMYESDTDSMTSLDTEKSAELKRGNHPQWRDKYTTKSLTNASNTEGLLSIAIKTIKLVKRNQLLQQRLTQLQLETSEFIESVLANPENRHFRENIKQKVKEVENV